MKSNSSSFFSLSLVFFFFFSCFLPSPLSSSLFFIYFLWQCHTGKHFLSLSLQPVRYWETKSVTFSPVSVILGSKFQSLCLQCDTRKQNPITLSSQCDTGKQILSLSLQLVWYRKTKSCHFLSSQCDTGKQILSHSLQWYRETKNKILSLSLQSVWYWKTNLVTFTPVGVMQGNKILPPSH